LRQGELRLKQTAVRVERVQLSVDAAPAITMRMAITIATMGGG
jgi:hypothetical protein